MTPASSTNIVKALQAKLIRLKYLAPGLATGNYGNRTLQAVMAFQGWVGLPRTGIMDSASYRALAHAKTPVSWGHNRKHMEVHKAQQVLLLIGKLGRVKRAIHVSTAGPGHFTPVGIFHIYRKEIMSWSTLFNVWLPLRGLLHGRLRLPRVPRRARRAGLARLHPDRGRRRAGRVGVRHARHPRHHPVVSRRGG